MQKNTILLIVNTVLVLGVIAYLLITSPKKEQLAYLELTKIYSEFSMKKELEAKLRSVQLKRQNILDSLKLDLKMLSREIENGSPNDKEKLMLFAEKKEAYYELDKKFMEDNENTAKMFDEQIFTQINQYTKDFGVKNNYTIIFGADGSGNLMYAKDALNITDEVKKYVNQRYKGKIN